MTTTDVPESVKAIVNQETAGERIPLALRLSGHLLVGVVRIHSKQTHYLHHDAQDALSKIRRAFRTTAVAPDVDLPENEQTAKESAITMRGGQDNEEFSLQDVDVDFGEYVDVEEPLGSQNVVEPRDITMSNAPEAMEHALHSLAQGAYDDQLPSAGGDWEVELGRAGSVDGSAGPVLFDDMGDMGGDDYEGGGVELMELEKSRDFFADAAPGIGGGLMDVSLEGGRISMVAIEDSVHKEPRPKRKRKASKAKMDAETQMDKRQLMRRVKGGEDAVADIYRNVEFVTPRAMRAAARTNVSSHRSSGMANDLMDLMRQPFESYNASESEERFVELPASQQLDSQPPVQFEDSVHDGMEDYGAADDHYDDAGAMDIDLPNDTAGDDEQAPEGEENNEHEEEEEGPLQSKRSQLFHAFLSKKFEETDTLSFEELVAGKSRLTVAGSFYELLLFKTHDIVGLTQEAAYTDISIHNPQKVMLSASAEQ